MWVYLLFLRVKRETVVSIFKKHGRREFFLKIYFPEWSVSTGTIQIVFQKCLHCNLTSLQTKPKSPNNYPATKKGDVGAQSTFKLHSTLFIWCQNVIEHCSLWLRKLTKMLSLGSLLLWMKFNLVRKYNLFSSLPPSLPPFLPSFLSIYRRAFWPWIICKCT